MVHINNSTDDYEKTMKLKISFLKVIILLMLLSGFNNAFAEKTIVNSDEAIVNAEEKVIIKGNYEFLNNYEFWLFIFGCGLISILVKIVDHAIKINGNETTQKIKSFTQNGSLLEWGLWFLSAAIVGFLGNLVGLFQASAQAAVMIGLGWPTVFAQLKQKYGPESNNKEIVKQQADGVHSDISISEERMTSNECYDIDEKEGK